MKIGVQGWFWNQKNTGIGMHVRGMVSALKSHADVHMITPEEVRPLPFLPAGLKKWFWERFQAPRALAQLDIDWEYYPYPCPLPVHSKHRRAMTVHDRIAWDDPRYQRGKIKAWMHRRAETSLQHVDCVFAVSHEVQNALKGLRSIVLPNATEFSARKSPLNIHAEPRILVYMGGYDIRKKVPDLVRAFTQLNDPRYELWLLGTPHHHSAFYPTVPNAPRVVKKGCVSEEEYRAILRGAFALVHASDAEGFNLPLLEAMASGVPAVVSDLPIHHEVSDETALFWNPDIPETLKLALDALEDRKAYEERVRRALLAASRYTWENSAQILIHATFSRSKAE